MLYRTDPNHFFSIYEVQYISYQTLHFGDPTLLDRGCERGHTHLCADQALCMYIVENFVSEHCVTVILWKVMVRIYLYIASKFGSVPASSF